MGGMRPDGINMAHWHQSSYHSQDQKASSVQEMSKTSQCEEQHAESGQEGLSIAGFSAGWWSRWLGLHAENVYLDVFDSQLRILETSLLGLLVSSADEVIDVMLILRKEWVEMLLVQGGCALGARCDEP